MDTSEYFHKLRLIILVCATSLGLCAGIVTSAMATDEPAKQSGSILVKFKAGATDAKIQEVADYYGARQVAPLGSSEWASRKDAELWREFKFESVDDLKGIARRILQDNRVDEVE
ncbi:MAG: hypothetical protein ABI479_02235 [Gallionella sp.]